MKIADSLIKLIETRHGNGFGIALVLKTAIRDAVEPLDLINHLRVNEGSSVEILCDNADFNGKPNCAIVVTDEFTGWEGKRFEGATVLECLRTAATEQDQYENGSDDPTHHG